MEVKSILSAEAHPWLLKRHYAKRIPSISFAFGLYDGNALIGVITYGMPASPWVCKGIAGDEYAPIVLELNRLCIQEPAPKNAASFLVGRSLRLLPSPRIVVSYADAGQGHHGYIYQASNFIYTGASKERTDIYAGAGKHARHHKGDTSIRQARSSKHRYIYFCGDQKQKKAMLQSLKYKQEPYPKGNNTRYDASAKIPTQDLLPLD